MSNSTSCIQHNKLIIDSLGYTGAFIFTIVLLPQLIKIVLLVLLIMILVKDIL